MSKVTQSLFTLISTFGVYSYAGDKLYLESGVRELNSLKSTNTQSMLKDFSGQAATSSTTTSYFVVQFKDGIKAADQKELAAKGIDTLRYIPDDAYVVRSSAAQLQALQNKNTNVRGFVP